MTFALSLKLALVGAVAAGLAVAQEAEAQKAIGACLITGADSDPFVATMTDAARQSAGALGIALESFTGDVDTQEAAMQTCIASGARGILITPAASDALAEIIGRARDAGILIIALDTPFNPAGIADATFAASDLGAGVRIGQWAAARLGDDAATARIALIDLDPTETPRDAQRDNGFLQGFGIDAMDPADIGEEEDPRIVGHDVSFGTAEGARIAMARLLRKDPGVNLVYAFDVAAAIGAHEELSAAGRAEQVLIVTIGGSCADVQAVANGVIDALSMPSPLRMGAHGVEAIGAWVKDGTWPADTPGLGYFDTGALVVTEAPIDGIVSVSPDQAFSMCRS